MTCSAFGILGEGSRGGGGGDDEEEGGKEMRAAVLAYFKMF